MTYPPQPGQNPGSGGFPQPPGQYPSPMPQYPGGTDPELRQQPSGGTAIAAGVLGVLGALFGIVFALIDFNSAKDLAGTKVAWLVWMQAIAYTIEVVTLGPGSILLFVRKAAGRWLVLAGSLVQVVQGIVAVIAMLSLSQNLIPDKSRATVAGAGIGGLLVVLAPAIATVILLVVPATGRWLAWAKQRPGMPPAYGQPSGYGPPPGYGQSSGYGPPPGA